MLQTLKERANSALGEICEAAAKEPHEASYAGNLRFFTDMVTLLEDRSQITRGLVEERSRALLRRAFSRFFSHLQNRDLQFDFDVASAPVRKAIRGNLAQWVEDNVDALVRAFVTDDDGMIVAADEGGMVDAPGAGRGVGGDGDDVRLIVRHRCLTCVKKVRAWP